MHICPLCTATTNQMYHLKPASGKDSATAYFLCNICQLVFVPAEQRLSARREKAIYDLHNNDPNDPGYRQFLSRLADPLLHRLQQQNPHPAQGLDFGCGPGPALADMLTEQGHSVALFDHFYANDPSVLQQQYDFITATEVIEHLYRPSEQLARLWRCLKPGGWLGIMTKLVSSQQAFATWHYIRDPTHVCFFSQATFTYWAAQQGASLEFIGKDVILLGKSNAAPTPTDNPVDNNTSVF